jgi:hypothetical protein
LPAAPVFTRAVANKPKEVVMSEQTRPCEICGQPIDPERLEAVPETRLCIQHARKIEKYGNEFSRSVSLEKTSKDGSLKRNYGGVNTHKSRNHKAMRELRAEYLREQEQDKG